MALGLGLQVKRRRRRVGVDANAGPVKRETAKINPHVRTCVTHLPATW